MEVCFIKTTIKSQLSHQESAVQSNSNLIFYTNLNRLLVPEAKLKREAQFAEGSYQLGLPLSRPETDVRNHNVEGLKKARSGKGRTGEVTDKDQPF